jgi:NAD(P)-dependent dehydrogenase (short-subunit alcohol dehydrogenase family)
MQLQRSRTTWRNVAGVTSLLAATALLGASLQAGVASADPSAEAQRPAHEREAGGDAGAQERRVILVTGSTGGLGREVALRLAASGAHVIVHGRSAERGQEVVAEIERSGVGSARFYAADLASFAEVRRLADEILRDYDRLDVLVNNAGIWLTQGDRQLSADGHEMHFQVNYLSGYLLTRRLLPLLEKSAPSRIVNVASGAQSPIDFDDVMLESGYSGSRAYAQSKLAQILFTIDLAEELKEERISVVSLHPATLMATDMVREAGIAPRATVDEGADAVMRLIEAAEVESGAYFNGLQPARPNAQAQDAEARARLRALSERIVNGESVVSG